MRIRTATSLLCVIALPAIAQDGPLSAIDWLAVQRDMPPVISVMPDEQEAPVAQSATVPDIDVQSLDAPSVGGAGLLPSAVTGLPTTLWRGSNEDDLVKAIERLQRRASTVPASGSLMQTLMLAEAAPPRSSNGSDLFAARVNALYERGLVAPAEALMERAGDLTPELFAQAFDLALITGSDEALCERLAVEPDLSKDLPTRIWCTTRSGDFSLAMTIYQTGAALGQMSALDEELLLRFLDPEYAEDAQPLRPP
ncbi:MAG TPA: hypothetical protein VJ928_07320, partial [Marivita sp.]|nr:hypothetical protein [Marivita sp.]